MSTACVLAVDGGNSKTDLALVALDGTVLAAVRGPGSSPHHIGLDGAVTRLRELYELARKASDVAPDQPSVGVFMLAGIDFVHEEEALHAAVLAQGWVTRPVVRNDTFAVLRVGTEAGVGVAVVCGAGINCVGVAADGRTVRFPALGSVTGDWGGGFDIGLGALGAAVRADDRRDGLSVLARIVPEHFGLATAVDVAIALHDKEISGWRLTELTPLVFAAAADGDRAATALVDRLADEVTAFAVGALTSLNLRHEEVDIVLGGGLLRAGSALLDGRIDASIRRDAPRARVVRSAHPPLVGAALLALEEAGAARDAHGRLRAQFAAGLVPRETRDGSTQTDEPMRALDT